MADSPDQDPSSQMTRILALAAGETEASAELSPLVYDDLRRLAARLADNPVRNTDDLEALEQWTQAERRDHPLIAGDSVDVVISNCVINLVRPEDRSQLFREIHRVLKRNGRAVISDIVCDKDVPQRLQQDPQLWSGCLSGAFREDLFLQAFAQAGFHGIRTVRRNTKPWRVVEGIEFRSVTVCAYKGQTAPPLEDTPPDDADAPCCGPDSGCC